MKKKKALFGEMCAEVSVICRDGHKAELTHDGHGSLEPGQFCSLLWFLLLSCGVGKRGGLEHARIVNPFGEQSWSQTAESEFMSVNGCFATTRCTLEQPQAEFC